MCETCEAGGDAFNPQRFATPFSFRSAAPFSNFHPDQRHPRLIAAMMERDFEESSNGLLASPASTSPLGTSSMSNVSSSPRSPVPSYIPSTSPSSFPVSPSAKAPLSVLVNGSDERGGRRGGVIVGRRGGSQRLSASEDLQERRREEADVDNSILSPRSAIRRQNALHHSYGADTITPTTSHATFAVVRMRSQLSTERWTPAIHSLTNSSTRTWSIPRYPRARERQAKRMLGHAGGHGHPAQSAMPTEANP